MVFPDGVGVLLVLLGCPLAKSAFSGLHVREAGRDVGVGAEVRDEVVNWVGRLLLPGLPGQEWLPLDVDAGGGGEGSECDYCFHYFFNNNLFF